MVCIDFDVDEYLYEASTKELRKEVERRMASGKWDDKPLKPGEPEPWTPAGLAEDLRKTFYCRDASRFEWLLCVLEPHQEKAA